VDRVERIADVRSAVASAREAEHPIALVPTMGGLHEGHLALVRAAGTTPTTPPPYVVVSIFVNPTQFSPGEDFASYPRDPAGDEAALRGLGTETPDLIYAPTVTEMYPAWNPTDGAGLATEVRVTGLTERLCGASRPGHFDGVCTVVSKLLHQVGPDAAYFGRKDFQQLQVLRRMISDLDLPVEIRSVLTVREQDGMALSTRNAYLEPAERSAAAALSAGLRNAVSLARRGRENGRTVPADVLRRAVLGRLDEEPLVRVDYVEVVDPDTLAPPDPAAERSRGQERLVAVAAHVGRARLIDNVVIGDAADEQALLDAVG
jgi:pantoate--beta-alanine ligase